MAPCESLTATNKQDEKYEIIIPNLTFMIRDSVYKIALTLFGREITMPTANILRKPYWARHQRHQEVKRQDPNKTIYKDNFKIANAIL